MGQENVSIALDELKELIQTPDFLLGKGLNNEVNIHFFCYDPKYEMEIRHFIKMLDTDQTLNCRLRVCPLYQIFLGLCDDKRVTDRIPAIEEKKGSDFILEQLHSFASADAFMEKLQFEGHQRGKDVLILTEVGEVFPFVRIHQLLERIQVDFEDIAVLVMYPGEYKNAQTRLFNLLTPHNYYRATRIITHEKE